MQRQGWFVSAAVVAVVLVGMVVMGRRQGPLTLTPVFQNEPLAVSLEFPDGRPSAGKTQQVQVQVTRDGEPFAVYDNSYSIHFIVASLDHTNFLHTVDLPQDEVGTYGTDVPFGAAGKYRIWVEVNDAHAEQHHGPGAGIFGYADFAVSGLGKGSPQPRVFAKQAQAGPYAIKLDHAPLKAGQPSEVRLTVEDNDGSIRQLSQPEPNIYVIVGPKGDPEFSFIRHGHSGPPLGGTTVVWRETFPEAGEYLLWTTVYLAGANANQQVEAVEVPFVLTVTE